MDSEKRAEVERDLINQTQQIREHELTTLQKNLNESWNEVSFS